MTVVIVIASADGRVLAGDSRTSTQIAPDAPVRVLSDFTHKVFQVGSRGVATYGWAFLDGGNIAGHMASFEAETALETDQTTRDLADRVASHFGDMFDRHIAAGMDTAPPYDPLGFLVAGYSESVGEVFEVTLPSRTVKMQFDTNAPGAAWRGQTDVIQRLIKGLDYEHLLPLLDQRGKMAEFEAIKAELDEIEYVVPFGQMNLQDAVDYGVFAIRTTIDTQRLTHGTMGNPGSWPGVGGPIEILTITPTGGGRWIQRTGLQGERKAGEADGS